MKIDPHTDRAIARVHRISQAEIINHLHEQVCLKAMASATVLLAFVLTFAIVKNIGM